MMNTRTDLAPSPSPSPGFLDRVLLAVAPKWALARMRARAAATHVYRHYEAAAGGRRTDTWRKSAADANSANGRALGALRYLARDLYRNNGWARNGVRAIARNTVGWGIAPKPENASDAAKKRARKLWADWAETKECDADGRLNIYGIQKLAIITIVLSGEVLIRRRRRRPEDKLTVPMQLQVLEPDFLDNSKDGVSGPSGGPIIQGVEFDKSGKRVAYWLYEQHPGANRLAGKNFVSQRVPASEVLHIYDVERPGQVRGASWLASVIVSLKDFDEYEDALLMRQKIAACFAAFVTDVDGESNGMGTPDPKDPLIETLEPGVIQYMQPGQEITFSSPPPVTDNLAFTSSTLRRIAAGLGVTYEDLTGDYSKVNFSSARMSRIAHYANVHGWRWDMLIPQLCEGVWSWLMETALIAGLIGETPRAEWTPPPMPMLEPDKEGLAYARLIRSGAMTFDEMVRERGGDPDTHWEEYAANLKRLDELEIWLDSDARRTSAAGLTQERGGGQSNSGEEGEGDGAEK